MPDPESVAAVSTAVSETMKGMGGLFGPARDEIGQMFADHARVFRAKNQLKLFQKTKRYMQDAAIPIGQVNLKVLFPLIESASLEEDETLQDMWAKLLVSASSRTFDDSVTQRGVNVLKEISTDEVRVLEYVYGQCYQPDWRGRMTAVSNFVMHDAFINIYWQDAGVESDVRVLIENLVRLGLLELPLKPWRARSDYHDERRASLDADNRKVELTRFGVMFMQICSEKSFAEKQD